MHTDSEAQSIPDAEQLKLINVMRPYEVLRGSHISGIRNSALRQTALRQTALQSHSMPPTVAPPSAARRQVRITQHITSGPDPGPEQWALIRPRLEAWYFEQTLPRIREKLAKEGFHATEAIQDSVQEMGIDREEH
jgi:hypothetical protein